MCTYQTAAFQSPKSLHGGIYALLHVISWPYLDIVSAHTVSGRLQSLDRQCLTLCQMIYEILQSAHRPSDSRWRLIFSLPISTFSALGVSHVMRYINAHTYLLTDFYKNMLCRRADLISVTEHLMSQDCDWNNLWTSLLSADSFVQFRRQLKTCCSLEIEAAAHRTTNILTYLLTLSENAMQLRFPCDIWCFVLTDWLIWVGVWWTVCRIALYRPIALLTAPGLISLLLLLVAIISAPKMKMLVLHAGQWLRLFIQSYYRHCYHYIAML